MKMRPRPRVAGNPNPVLALKPKPKSRAQDLIGNDANVVPQKLARQKAAQSMIRGEGY